MAQYIYALEKARKAHGDKVVLDNVTLTSCPAPRSAWSVRTAPVSRACSDHGGAGPAEQRRGQADARLHRRHAVAGAAAERGEDRPRQHRGGGRRDQGEARAVQRDRRGDGHRLLRRADGGDGPAAGGAGPRRRVGHRLQAELAMDALRCPPPDADVTKLSGGERRRVALCKLLLEAARPAAARRAHQPPGRRERAVAGAAPGQVRRHRHRHHPRPVLPRQRGRAGSWNSTAAGPYPYEGNYSTYLEKKAAAPGDRGPQGRQDEEAPRRRAGLGPLQRQGAPDQVQGPSRPVRGDGNRGGEDPQARLRGDPDPAGSAPGQHGDRGATS